MYEEKDSEHEDEVINVVMIFLMMMSKAKTFVLLFNYCSNKFLVSNKNEMMMNNLLIMFVYDEGCVADVNLFFATFHACLVVCVSMGH